MNKSLSFLPEDLQNFYNLREILEKEIRITRELLANLHQEEVCLMLHDTGSLSQIFQMRFSLLENLSSLRLDRSKMTEVIQKKLSPNTYSSLQELLPPNEEIGMEILYFSDQLNALTERFNLQMSQNQRLSRNGDPMRFAHVENFSPNRPKRKASVTTINALK